MRTTPAHLLRPLRTGIAGGVGAFLLIGVVACSDSAEMGGTEEIIAAATNGW